MKIINLQKFQGRMTILVLNLILCIFILRGVNTKIWGVSRVYGNQGRKEVLKIRKIGIKALVYSIVVVDLSLCHVV